MTISEFELIARYFRPLTLGRPEALSLLDDAGVLSVPAGSQLVVTTDALVEGRHFLAGTPAIDVAHQALGVNLSDLAAKGATPHSYTLDLVLPKGQEEAWIAAFVAGLADVQGRHGLFLLGGDTAATDGPLTLAVTAFGLVPEGRMLTRGGARAGDDLWVSGTVGDGALGLLVARDGRTVAGPAGDRFLAGRYRRPQPRTALGRRLIGLATACADVSDGLAADVGHIAEVSGLSARIDGAAVPLSAAARAALDADSALLETILTGGDDYELAFTAPPGAAEALAALSREAGLPLTRIGAMAVGSGVTVTAPGGGDLALKHRGFTHF